MDFKVLQRRFAAYLRDPEHAPAPVDIEPRRLAIYRDLFFDNLASLLAGTFPVCHEILGEQGWRRLVRRFYSEHRAHTPYFLELPGEFAEWLAAHPGTAQAEPPFLAELAHYEWLELALSVSEAQAELAGVDPAGDLLAGLPVASPLAWPMAYRWPVHRLCAAYQPAEAPSAPTFLVVYRDAADTVRFIEADAATARLLELIDSAEPVSGRELLQRIATELGAAEGEAVLARGRALLESLRERGILLGTRTLT